MIEKWLLKLENGKLRVIKRNIRKEVPINRMLDVAGTYSLDSFEVGETNYMIVYDPYEYKTQQSKILVSKIGEKSLVSMDESDFENVEAIAKHYLGELLTLLN